MVPEFEEVVFALELIRHSPVFETRFGFHIALATARRAAGRLSIAEATPLIESSLLRASARFMEAYEGYLTYTDYEVGRLMNHLKEINQGDNTLVFISIGDNGASKEGTLNGDIDRAIVDKPLSEQETINYNLAKIGEIGTAAATQENYPLGWAQAANTPFKFWKQDANSEGAPTTR